VAGRKLHLDVSDDELAKRRSEWKPLDTPARGYAKLHETHVMQADTGCDLDFLVGKSGAEIPRESH
jgi:L-arabonate dehydrase